MDIPPLIFPYGLPFSVLHVVRVSVCGLVLRAPAYNSLRDPRKFGAHGTPLVAVAAPQTCWAGKGRYPPAAELLALFGQAAAAVSGDSL